MIARHFDAERQKLKGPAIKGRVRTKEEIFNNLKKDEVLDFNNEKTFGFSPSYTRITKGRYKDDYLKDAYNNGPYLHKDFLKRDMQNYESVYLRNTKTGKRTRIKTYENGPYQLKEDIKSVDKKLSSQDYMNNPTKGITVSALKKNNGSLSTKGYRFDIDNKGSKVWVSGNGVKKTFDNLTDAKEFVTRHDAKRESAITKRLRSGYRRNEGRARHYSQY